jgi:hypothetical protein
MIVLEKTDQRPKAPKLKIPQRRPSILDAYLDGEPYLDHCPCSDRVILFLENYPIAVIPGSSLDYYALSMRLNQMRHRWPRQ